MNDIVREFLVESHESLAQLDRDLVTLEREPGDRETLARVFRTVHTVKGTAGFLGLGALEAVGHAGESLLSRVRSGDLAFTPEVATALLGTVDAIREMLAALEASEGDGTGDGDYTAVIQGVERLLPARRATREPAAPPPVVPPEPPASPEPPAPTPEPPAARAPEAVELRASAVSDSNVRVDVKLLDHLMTLVGELVLARNQIVQSPGPQEDAGFPGTVQRLDLITTELHKGVMKTRMQPVATVWAKFPRVVRDLAAACGKQVRLELQGQETELDRTVVEAVKDPLTHLVRNAVDHGIEAPAARAARGKPAEGRLLLRAYQESGKVVIEIADDGGGIDPGRVRDKALAAKLVAPEEAARMSENELVNLIFLPGFSTADRVTHVSGRGVGMDVVRTNVEAIGGHIEVASRPGHGTTVRMRIPLTLAIVPALLVSAAGDRYAIPQSHLLELVRLEGPQVARGVESLHGAPVHRLRGALLPLVYLDRELGLGGRPAGDELNVVVLQADDRRFGLVVDHIHDTEEIVVKPLQPQVKGAGVYSGATILGDGRVAMILDVVGLARRARVLRGARERARAEVAPPAPPVGDENLSVLLFDAPDGGRMAVPTPQVARLEEVPWAAVERVGGRDLLQYRGAILPLVHLGPRPGPGAGVVQVVVLAGPGGRAGLVVDRVVDIVEEPLPARSPAPRPGVLFSAVVLGRITEVLDVDAVLGRGATSGFVAVPAGEGGRA